MPTKILVVDDEEKIRQTLRGVLSDEGYEVSEASDGRTALDSLRAERPDLVILDVWLPEIDGIALLEEVKRIYADLPVIIICGHANIEAAVRATRLGAADFIEKPFSLDALLASIGRALGKGEGEGGGPAEAAVPLADEGEATRPQKTIAKSVVASGQGLHTGVRTGVILHPAGPGTGIVFQSLATEKSVPAHVDFADSTGYATTLFRGGFGAKTVEHLLATLNAYGITNLIVKMEGEVPALDGSALEFCRMLDEAGAQDQSGAGIKVFEVERRFEVKEADQNLGERTLVVEPYDGFAIDYTLDYPAPVGQQRYVFEYTGADSFRDQIAPARTFGFVHEFTQLASVGLAAGGRLDNCVLIGEDGVVNGELRFPDEFVRHKILDVMGDFALLGRPIRGKIVARATGHRHNVGMVRTLLAAAA